MRARVYKHGIQWRVDVPQSPFPVQLFDWQHAMDIANEYARMAQFAECVAEDGPGWRELAAVVGNQPGMAGASILNPTTGEVTHMPGKWADNYPKANSAGVVGNQPTREYRLCHDECYGSHYHCDIVVGNQP